MAYIVLTFDQREIHRQELTETITVGRSPECDVSVRDIQLSRRHCRIEMTLDGWTVEDLASKNGTHAAGRRIGRKRLSDADELRIGRTRIRFFTGAFMTSDARSAPAPKSRARPADPFEAMAGTVCAFEFGKDENASSNGAPKIAPRPRPSDPAGYAREDLYTMLTAIASSSWDSIYATASRPIETETLPTPMVKRPAARMREVMKQELHVSSLQAHPHHAQDAPTPRGSKRDRVMLVAAVMVWCAVVYSAMSWTFQLR